MNDTVRGSGDPLAICLAAAARLYGESVSPEALIAGLPIEDGRLTPALAGRAAERAGLAATIVAMPLATIPHTALPVILLTQDRGACVLVKRGAVETQIIAPDSPAEERTVPLAELAARYEGHAIMLSHVQRFAAGTESERLGETHHWFWGTLRQELRTYSEVALATVLVNVFALASPLFFMNVYD
ncbi:MAG: type I secretion system permease/ATPase, partial [Betaproteobacteria bacterium]|nr:type I secretion system permease/ATPase [Betaproteobacteria bacterium]